jgi:RimJ/RimL family protein N-acetyltransferase
MDLVPATERLLRAEIEGPRELGVALGVEVGPGWPPALYDAEALDWSLDQIRNDARFAEWGMHYLVLRGSPDLDGSPAPDRSSDPDSPPDAPLDSDAASNGAAAANSSGAADVAADSGEATTVVIGIAGYKGPALDDGSVEIGYSVLPAFQRRGLATEAVLGLVDRAFESESVERVLAHTLPHLEPSIGVLCKAGFSFEGEVTEEGQTVVRYARERGTR